MRKKNIRIMITALLTAVLSFSPIAAHAEPSDASKEDPQEVLEEISMEEAPMGEASVEEMSMGTPMEEVLMEEGSMEEVSTEELSEEEGEETEGIPEGVFVHTEGFSRNYSMNGLFSQCIEYFNTEEWHIRSAEFIMIYDVTQLKDGDISDFTVSLNGEPFYSGRFLQETNGKQTLRLVLPMELIKDGINELKIESYVRTRDSLPCVDDVSQANWFNISADSAVNIVYMPDTYAGTIADFYRKLTSIYAMENQKSAVFIPSAITDTAITAAANILTGVSKNAKADYQKLRLLTSENVLEECAAQGLDWAVYVGEWDFLPEAVKDGFSDALKKEMVTNGAALQLLSYEKVSLLVLTGTNPELLEKGAKMFGNADYMNQMTDTIHVITEQENPVMEKKEPLEYSALTAEGGGYADGTFRQTFSFVQSAYANKLLSPVSEIYLKMRYSKNIDFERSLMTVYINDIPIGSHKLSQEAADDDEAEFFLPADIRVGGDFTVKVAFDLEVEDLWCTLRQGETPWAYISPDSMMKIVLADNIPLLFEHYPAPFLKTKSLDNVLIALPKAPAQEEIQALQQICLSLGRFTENNAGNLAVKQEAALEDCRGKNVIVIGTPKTNPLIGECREQLYFKFNETGTAFVTNEKKRITEEAGKAMGTLQLVESPFGEENRGMLFVTGPTLEAMSKAAQYLAEADMLWKLTGDGTIVFGEELQNYQFKEDNRNIIATAKEVIERDDVLQMLVTSLAVAVVIILGLIFICVKHIRGRRGRKRERAKEGKR